MDRNVELPLAVVVEDEALLALEMEDALAAEGFRTLIACTPAAVQALPEDGVAVAVVNLRLNDHLIGQDVIRRLRRRRSDLPVVVVTGYDGDAPQADLRGLGWPTIRLQKPLEGAALTVAVREVMARASSGRQPPRGRRQEDKP